MIVEGTRLHLFLQQEFDVLGGAIEHLVSNDGGVTFLRHRTALRSDATRGEAGSTTPTRPKSVAAAT